MRDSARTEQNMDEFLASVEKQSFIMARMATHDPDAALDIVQDTMLQMVKNYSKKPYEEWRPLFFRILGNKITDYHRNTGVFGRMTRWFGWQNDDDNHTEDAVNQLASETQEPDQELQNDQLGVLLLNKLNTLPARQQQVISLRMWQGLSVEETAVAMNVSVGSVKTHLHRALKVMQARMSEYKGS